jgi:hypothetical protein
LYGIFHCEASFSVFPSLSYRIALEASLPSINLFVHPIRTLLLPHDIATCYSKTKVAGSVL